MIHDDHIIASRGVVHVPTPHSRQTVRDLISFGVSRKSIAAYLKIQLSTLSKNYTDELECGLVHANMMVAKKLYEKALEGDTTSILFWLKTRGRWVEPEKVQQKPQQDSILEMLQGLRGGRVKVEKGITIDQGLLEKQEKEQSEGIEYEIVEQGSEDMPEIGEVDWSESGGEIR